MKKTFNCCNLYRLSKFLRIMRITVFLLLLATMQTLAGSALAQRTKLSFSVKDMSVAELLEQIENKTDIHFFYQSEDIDNKELLSIDVENKTIDEILKAFLPKLNLKYETFDKYIAISKTDTSLNNLLEQEIDVKGKVKDASGGPLPGVSVVIKGTTMGTITDFDGNFNLSTVPINSTLIFSFVGMRTVEIKVADQSSFNITMEEDAIGIEEVVAIGYGVAKKSDLTGAVVKADIEAFREQPNINIVQSLQGSVPGLNVGITNDAGESPGIRIRGYNSLSGSTSPLIILDGVIYRGPIGEINPDDVESVDVLKDASSAAIYGSEAANGVMIITTKRGEKGEKPQFSYSSYYTIQEPASRLTPLNREEYIQKVKDVYWNESRMGDDYLQENPDFDVNLKLGHSGVKKYFDDGYDTDWYGLVTNDHGHIQNHNLSVSGNTKLTNYYLSSSFTEQEGYIINDKYKKWTIRANFENQITDWMKLGLQSYVTSADNSGVSPDLRTAYLHSPVVIPYNPESGELDYNPQAGSITNPLQRLEETDLNKRLNLFANFNGEIKLPFIKGLKYRFNYSHNYRTSRNFGFNPAGENFAGSGNKDYGTAYNWTFDNILNYSKVFNDIHDVTATLVYGRESREYEGTESSSGVFVNPDLGYNKLEAGSVDKMRVNSDAWEENSLYSMGRLQYKLNNRYLATVTVRRDGFSGFGEDNKFGVFPSGALAWVISEEDFMKSNDWINFLKLRTSYGQTGNRTVGRYSTLATVNSGNSYVFGDGGSPAIGIAIGRLPNSGLKWETTVGLNLGLDFSVLNQRLHGNIEYYNTETSDILYNINIPTIDGFSSVTTNIGKVTNWGVEASVTSLNVKSSNFTWESTVNFSLNRNEVVSILGKDDDGDGKEDDLVSNSLFIGESRGAIYSYVIDGIYQLGDEVPSGFNVGGYRLKDLSGPDGTPDGEISAAHDREIIGYTVPAYRFSIQNQFAYKNWMLRVFVNSIQGGKNYYYESNTPYVGAWSGGDNITNWNIVKEWDYWTPENPGAEYPALEYVAKVRPNTYKQRSFVRLQDVSLSYKFNKKLFKGYIQGLKLYVSGKNLYTWTKWKGNDPELGAGISDSAVNPVLRSYSLGVNLQF